MTTSPVSPAHLPSPHCVGSTKGVALDSTLSGSTSSVQPAFVHSEDKVSARSSDFSKPDVDLDVLPILTSETPLRLQGQKTYTRARAHCIRRRRLYWFMAGMLAIMGLAGLVYAVSVQILWDRYEAKYRGISELDPPVFRIWAHSHNDEMQREPLSLALRLGFGSIEIDTWFLPSASDTTSGILSVGHERQDLNEKTLTSTYLEPLLTILDTNNANTTMRGNDDWIGLFPSDPKANVQLVFDIKNEPDLSFTALSTALLPFRQKGYLTTYDQTVKRWISGPLTIILTGDGPLAAVYHSAANRTIFYDAPLASLHKPFSIPETIYGSAVQDVEWDASIAPLASAKLPLRAHFAVVMPPPPANIAVRQLAVFAAEAKERGIKTRWWGAARSDRWVRERIWAVIKESGAEWTGGDDLDQMAQWLSRHDRL